MVTLLNHPFNPIGQAISSRSLEDPYSICRFFFLVDFQLVDPYSASTFRNQAKDKSWQARLLLSATTEKVSAFLHFWRGYLGWNFTSMLSFWLPGIKHSILQLGSHPEHFPILSIILWFTTLQYSLFLQFWDNLTLSSRPTHWNCPTRTPPSSRSNHSCRFLWPLFNSVALDPVRLHSFPIQSEWISRSQEFDPNKCINLNVTGFYSEMLLLLSTGKIFPNSFLGGTAHSAAPIRLYRSLISLSVQICIETVVFMF